MSKPVGIALGGDCNAINVFEVVTVDSVAAPEEGWLYPNGMVRLELPCSRAQVSLIFGQVTIAEGATARKYGPRAPDFGGASLWYQLSGASVDAANGVVTFNLTDGELGDATGEDGVIVDPVALAEPEPEPPAPSAVPIPVNTGLAC